MYVKSHRDMFLLPTAVTECSVLVPDRLILHAVLDLASHVQRDHTAGCMWVLTRMAFSGIGPSLACIHTHSFFHSFVHSVSQSMPPIML